MKSIKEFFLYGFDFVGVTDRRGFWIPMSCVVVIEALLGGLSLLGTVFQLLLILAFLVLLTPTLAIIARRLHDTDRSALNLLWLLLPLVGPVIIFIYCAEKTKYFV